MTDAVHMLTDVVGILFSLLALWFSNKPPTKRFSFGLHRLGKVPLPPVSFFSLSLLCFVSRRPEKCLVSSVRPRSDYRRYS